MLSQNHRKVSKYANIKVGYVFLVVLFSCHWSVKANAQPESDQYAGDAACLECHEPISDKFSKSTHGMKSISRSPAALDDGFACESCHGPGAEHAEEGGGGNIRVLSKDSGSSSQELNDLCMQCHTRGKTAMWENSSSRSTIRIMHGLSQHSR